MIFGSNESFSELIIFFFILITIWIYESWLFTLSLKDSIEDLSEGDITAST